MAVGSIASVLSVSIGAALIVAGLYDARPALTGVVSSSGSIFVFAGMALLWREQRVMLQKWAVVTFVFTVVLPIGLVLSSQSLTEIKPAVVPILWLIVIEIFLFSGILLRWKLRKNPAKSATEVAVHLPGDKVS